MGLDIGTSSVKYVQLKKKGRLTKLVGYGKVPIPKNTVIEGVISETEKLAGLIKDAFDNPQWGKITADRVYVSLPESKLFTRIIDLPVVEEKDIKEAITYEIEQTIPMAQDDLYIDWQVIDQAKDKSTVFLSAGPKSIINSYIQLLDILGLEPQGLEMSLAAIARSMVSNKQKVDPVIILDIGDQSSSVAVFDSNLRVTGSQPIGGGTIKERLMKELGINEEEALKETRFGIGEKGKAAVIIQEEMDKLIAEVKKMVDYYKQKFPDAEVKTMLLCGGLGFMPGLSAYLEKKGFAPKVGNPWVNISIYPIKPVPKEEVPGYATAIGLCLRGFEDD